MEPKVADDLDIVDELFDVDGPNDGSSSPAGAQQQEADPAVMSLLDEIRQLRDEVAQQQEQPSQTAAPAVEPAEDTAPTIDIPQVDDAQLGKLAKYKDKLEAIAKSATGPDLQAVTEHLKELKEELKRLQDGVQEQAKVTFAQQLRIAIPDIDQLHEHDEFKAYLRETAPLSGGRTIGSLLKDAYDSGDLARVQEIIGAYKEKQQQHASASPSGVVRPPVSGLGAPQHYAAHATTGDAGDLDAKYIRASQKLLEMYRAKKLDDAAYQAKVQKLQEKYEAKQAEGDVALSL